MNVTKQFEKWTVSQWKQNVSQRVASGQLGEGDSCTWTWSVPVGVIEGGGDIVVKENPDLGGNAKFTITKPNGKTESKSDMQSAKFGSTKQGNYSLVAEVTIHPGDTTNYDAVLTLVFPK